MSTIHGTMIWDKSRGYFRRSTCHRGKYWERGWDTVCRGSVSGDILSGNIISTFMSGAIVSVDSMHGNTESGDIESREIVSGDIVSRDIMSGIL